MLCGTVVIGVGLRAIPGGGSFERVWRSADFCGRGPVCAARAQVEGSACCCRVR